MVGVEWKSTEKTTGSLGVGRIEKEFEDDGSTQSGPIWSLDVRWSPRTYSHIDIGMDRVVREGTALSTTLIVQETYTVAWNHSWNERLSTRVLVTTILDDYLDPATNREEDLDEYGIELAYEATPRLTVEGSLERSSRNSSVDRFVFDGTIVGVAARLMF
jgi:hypothetical protein